MIAGFFKRSVEFDILPMEPEHTEAAAALHAARFSRAWSADELDALIAQTNVHGFVARPNGADRRAVGGFALARFAANEAEILTIAVAEKWQGRGLGWRLMLAATRQVRQDGAEKLFLEVDENNRAAIALYHRLGFAKVAERNAYYRQPNGERTAALVMRLDLV
jgi:[ribosomal protein S18]-alanine N-acetyltransferase